MSDLCIYYDTSVISAAFGFLSETYFALAQLQSIHRQFAHPTGEKRCKLLKHASQKKQGLRL